MNMTTLEVRLGERSYPIHIGNGILPQAGILIKEHITSGSIAVVADATVAKLHGPALIQSLESAGIKAQMLTVPSGEGSKSFAQLERVSTWLLEQKIERDGAVIAFGGGVIGDLVGFAAAILRRGVRFVQIPTTLLAQVDSSVGGKTGINTSHGKNLIGAFHQPSLVLADVAVLGTLSQRDFLSGYGEVVKYGLLGDDGFFSWLEENGPALSQGDNAVRIEAIARSCQMKADIVARDETEKGDRALLNLGHTFGHAFEAATGYSDRLLHGEAVAMGCVLAFELASRLGICAQEVPSRVRSHFQNMNLHYVLADIAPNLPPAAELIELMYQDKKVTKGQINFVLPRAVGQTFIARDVDLRIVQNVLSDALLGPSGQRS